tara:strand:+ start:361 stop:531 length:171 start_codon:yes stop_codon:yes gene_type:complete
VGLDVRRAVKRQLMAKASLDRLESLLIDVLKVDIAPSILVGVKISAHQRVDSLNLG